MMQTHSTDAEVVIRHANTGDVPALLNLLDAYADRGLLLKRTAEDLMNRITDFSVAVCNAQIIGCVALKDYGGNLFEIRSLAVAEKFQGRGVASQLISNILAEIHRDDSDRKVFALTYHPNLFCRLGFQIVCKETFPQKIWDDCAICPHLLHCDETAVLRNLNTQPC